MMKMMMAMMDKAAATAEATAAAQSKMNRDMFMEFANMMKPQLNPQDLRAHQPREAKLHENKLGLKDFTRIKEFEGGESCSGSGLTRSQ